MKASERRENTGIITFDLSYLCLYKMRSGWYLWHLLQNGPHFIQYMILASLDVTHRVTKRMSVVHELGFIFTKMPTFIIFFLLLTNNICFNSYLHVSCCDSFVFKIDQHPGNVWIDLALLPCSDHNSNAISQYLITVVHAFNKVSQWLYSKLCR